MKKLIFLLLLCSSFYPALAQKQNIALSQEYYSYEDSLKRLSYKIIHHNDEVVRRNSTSLFIRTLVATLKLPNSFAFPFDSVKYISILKSADEKFRIFTWHLKTDDGRYRYYGAVQVNNPSKLELYALFDNTIFTPNPEDTIVNKDGWYGAHYYSIVAPAKGKRNKQYVLLGWKGHNSEISQKVIDVLSFDKTGAPVFGAPIFKMNDKTQSRIVFRHAATVSMIVRYLPSKQWIVYDHLAAPNGSAEGAYEVYGPDLSYDGLAYKRKKWVLMENIDLRNEKSELDKLFIDPRDEQ